MHASRKKLIQVLKNKCGTIDSTFIFNDKKYIIKDYDKELFRTVANIIYEENNHLVKATTIQKNIYDECDKLGVYIIKGKSR